MADALQAAAGSIPHAVVVLTGNVHASKVTLPEIGPYPLMASFLPAKETISLFVIDRGGEAWNCQKDCGPHQHGSSNGDQRRVNLSPGASPLAGFDGVLSTGLKATPSPPAVDR